MKNKILLSVMALAIISLSFKIVIDKSEAKAETKEGLILFHLSKPTVKYDIISSVNLPNIASDRCDKRIDILVARCKKNNPSAEALILNEECEKAEVIKFKD